MQSGTDGLFTITSLPAGVYEIVATLPGFAEQRQERVEIGSGEMFVSRMELRKAPLAETVSLTDASFDMEPMRAAPASTIGGQEILLLPNPSRDALDFLRLSPLLSPDGAGGTWSALGLPASFVGLAVDGGDNQSPVSSQPVARRIPARGGYQFSDFTIQELHVTAGAAPAEFGHAASAFTGLITRSGSNVFTGQLFERYRDSALSGATPVDEQLGREHTPLHANQFGATFGGPLAVNRSAFFAAYDGLRERNDNPVVLELPDVFDSASLAGAAQLRDASAPWPVTRTQDVALVRLDNRLGESQRLSLRYNHHNLRGDGLEQHGTHISRDATGSSRLETRSLAVSLGTTAGGRFFNDLQLFHVRDRDAGTAYSTAPQADVRDGGALLLRVGGDATNPHDTRLQRWQAVDSLSWEGGRHAMKAGIDIAWNDVSHQFGTNAAGSYVFDSLATFGTGVLQLPGETFTQTFVPGGGTNVTTTPDSHEYAGVYPGHLAHHGHGDLECWRPIRRASVRLPGLRSRRRSERQRRDWRRHHAPTSTTWRPGSDSPGRLSSRYLVRAAYGMTYARTPCCLPQRRTPMAAGRSRRSR